MPYRTDVVDAEIIDDMPPRAELIKVGAAALDATGVDPDSWVDADTEAQLRRATPENTLKALRWGWGRWIWWCGRTGRNHLPAHPNSVRQYIKDHWEMRRADGSKRGRHKQPYAPKTVELAVYVISMIHRRLGYHSPLEDPKVAAQLEGYRGDFERAGHRTDESDPISHAQSVTLARACDLGTVQGLRNAAMVRGQFDLGCRAGEWCTVQGQDVSWESEDFVVITFTGTFTKTGKKRVVAMQAVRHVDWDADPVRLLLAYWRARQSAGWDGTGPLWVEVRNGPRRKDFDETGILGGRFGETPVNRETYEKVFNRLVAKTGIDLDPVKKDSEGKPMRVRHITTHSNRAGMITEAVDAGIPLEKVAKRTGHSPASPVIHGYYRSGRNRDEDNAGWVIRQAARKRGERDGG